MSRREIPEILIEQLELGELSDPRRAAIEAELAGAAIDPREALRASNAEILNDYPSERVMAEVRRRAVQIDPPRARAGRAWLPWVLVPSLAGAAALVVVVVVGERGPEGAGAGTGRGTIARLDPGPAQGETTRIKGGADAHLVVDRKRGEGHERLAADELVREGELVQISVVADGHTQAVVLSIDGRGVVTLHHPAAPDEPATLAKGEEVPLANSYLLDAAPGFERFVLITRSDDAAIDVAAVMAVAEALAGDPIRARGAPLELVGEGWQQRSLTLRKPDADEPAPTPAEGPR